MVDKRKVSGVWSCVQHFFRKEEVKRNPSERVETLYVGKSTTLHIIKKRYIGIRDILGQLAHLQRLSLC